ncbi:MAG: hypothetical protein FWG81_10645 [Betaproteobacteria bacterium]|nr:hypothetical protein [Betaproteobacteria bacterium]
MTLISRVSFGGRPEWLNKRRSAPRTEPGRIMPADSIHPDGSSSPHEHLMTAFRSFRLAWLQKKEEGDKREEGKAEEEKASHTASRLASELAMLDREEKQRLLKKAGLDVVV